MEGLLPVMPEASPKPGISVTEPLSCVSNSILTNAEANSWGQGREMEQKQKAGGKRREKGPRMRKGKGSKPREMCSPAIWFAYWCSVQDWIGKKNWLKMKTETNH